MRKLLAMAAAILFCFAGTAIAAEDGICAKVRNEKINDGRSPALRPLLKAKDAIWYNQPDELTALIEDCVRVDEQDQYGWTLLHHAADRDRSALAKILLAHGAQQTIRNKDGKTAAQLAQSPEMKALLGPSPAPIPAKTGPKAADTAASSSRAKQCNERHYSSSALCSDSTCKMREYRKWQTCLKTGSYY